MSFHTPSLGFVHLILFSPRDEDCFYLEIPIEIVATVSLSPRKYLRYLGWCVLGVEGVLVDEQGNGVPLNGELVNQGVYQYNVPGDNPLAHAVNLDVIKQRSQYPSETTASREDFRSNVLERDGCCVWTGLDGAGMHIIPHGNGSDWLELIVNNRPHLEDLTSISINDIRNGIFGADSLHNHYFEPRHVVVLKTPNLILETTDIPNRAPRDMPQGSSYPETSRYTLQWIADLGPFPIRHFPNNSDAAFVNQDLAKPADLLLHYNYGAAVVKKWGKNTSILSQRQDIPRPSIPVPAPMGPKKTVHDRNITIQKRAMGSTGQKKQTAGNDNVTDSVAVDSEVQDSWDEDDVMLFFWANSKVAQERAARKEQEHNRFVEEWRSGVTGGSLSV